MKIAAAQRMHAELRARSFVAVVSLGVVMVSCSTTGPDISTPEAACQAVADTLELLASNNAKERELGVTHAETIWVKGNEDEAVSSGMRRSCASDVLEMLDASGIPRSALDETP